MIKANIVGGAGYTAGELLRILVQHPEVQIGQVTSNSQQGKFIYELHQDLLGDIEQRFVPEITESADVTFICSGHGKSKSYLEDHDLGSSKIVDLSRDFRIQPNTKLGSKEFVYGLPERNRDSIKSAENIANPGCFATAMQLALLPLAKENLLNAEIHISGITGSTGAGQKLQATTHFSWRNNNVSTYKTFTHQHLEEVYQSIRYYRPENQEKLRFIPYRGDFPRGIMINLYTTCNKDLDTLRKLYADFYAEHPLSHVSETPIHLKQVTNTAKALIHVDKHDDQVLVSCAIDNLLKGASGQAVQNMNLMFGFAENTGLKLKGNYF